MTQNNPDCLRFLNVECINCANPQADMSKLEGEIDQLLYQLYGLTKEEIEIV